MVAPARCSCQGAARLAADRPAEARARDELRRLRGCLPNRKGANVARKRPAASDVHVVPVRLTGSARQAGPGAADRLSHAQTHALLRCTPLTRAESTADRGVP